MPLLPVVSVNPATVGCANCASSTAKVTGSLPEAFTRPYSTSAIASPPPIPGYQASTIPFTRLCHGIDTGPPVSSTTTVFGFAFATASTSASCPTPLSSGKLSVALSIPSLIHCVTNTIATCAFAAAFAASATSVPASKLTVAPSPACSFKYRSGDDGKYTAFPHSDPPGRPPGASTCADPPPDSTPSSACPPITMIVFPSPAATGKIPPSFFSSTRLSSSIFRASSRPLNGSTTRRTGGWSITPVANILRTIRRTISSTRASGTFPSSTACFSEAPKYPYPGCSISNPASAAFTVLCVPSQSDSTNPLNPHSFFNTSVSVYWFSHA